ncbi:MAG: carboxypeptidase-like regulatory domain-containing protein [Chitinophagaceae bacterium]
MKIRFLFFLAGALFYGMAGIAQSTIMGQVLDAETKLPLEGASVFAQNTTLGTITDKEGNFKLQLKRGGYELVVSYTGYTSKRVNIEANENQTINIQLQKEDNSLSEVVIKSSNEVPDGWEKYGSFFIAHFIGATPNAAQTSLENPDALKFYYYKKSDKLKVLATEPLQILNNALGYQLRYSLDSFVYYYKTQMNSYRGNCLYQALEGDTAQQITWNVNRNKVYRGSRLHFLRSYYDSAVKEEGFTVDMLTKAGAGKFSRLANPYDTAYFLVDDSTFDVELWFPKKASITYTKTPPETEYLTQFKLPLNVTMQISYVDLLDVIVIKQNGFFIDQKHWINHGYWSWKNLADQLPYDYVPTELNP